MPVSPRPIRRRVDGEPDRSAVAAARVMQLERWLSRRQRATEALADVGRSLVQGLDAGVVGQGIADSVRELFEAQSAALLSQDPVSGDLTAVAVSGDVGPTEGGPVVLRRGIGLSGLAVSERGPVWTPDLLADPRVRLDADMRNRVAHAPYRAVLCVPLLLQGRVTGVLGVGADAGRVFGSEEIRLLQAFADQAALNLEQARLYADETRRRREAEALARVARTLTESLDVTAVSERIVQSVASLLGVRSAGLHRLLPDGSLLSLGSARPSGPHMAPGHVLPPGTGISGRAVREGRPVRSEDVLEDARLDRTEEMYRLVGASAERAFLAVPIRAKGEIIGALSVSDRKGRRFSDEEITLLETFADQAALALENARLYEAATRGEQEVAEKRAFLQTTLEHLGQGVSVGDGDLRLVAWNSRFLDLLDFPREFGRVGKPFEDFVRYDAQRGEYGPGDPEEHVARRVALSRRFEPHMFERIRPDGRVIEVRGSPMSGGGFVTTYTDITERKKGDEALRLSEAQLRQAQKMDAVGRLAGGVAHDFNNLLTVVTGRSEILLRLLAVDDPRRRHADLIQQTALRAADLTHQLLAFSRKQMLQPRVLDLNAVVVGMEGMLRRLIGEHIELVSRCAGTLGRVKADPSQIEQVVVNLVVNARDAMPHGGVLTVHTADVELDPGFVRTHVGARPGPHVLLAVTDTGIGMDPETRAQVFEPFFTTKGPGKGTGLGLATVYGIVKQSGGYVWVESEAGHGARFEIYLPRVEGRAESMDATFSLAGLPSGTETVLLVEDQDELRDLSREMLQMVGYRVLEARNGREALRIASSHGEPIHLLLTDVVMPYMGGRELADHLLPSRREMRVLYMSGYTDDAIVHHGVLDPGTAFIQKPFASDALAQRVREVLNSARG